MVSELLLGCIVIVHTCTQKLCACFGSQSRLILIHSLHLISVFADPHLRPSLEPAVLPGKY